MGKIRCPLRPQSMTLDRDRPEILTPPEHPQACCTQQTLTVPPEINAKTRQKHDYPSAGHRRSYARRTGAERGFATAKDRATNDISRGWCRLTGLAPLMLFTTTLLIVRNQRILHAWNARQEENQRRATQGLPPKPAAADARPSPRSPPPPGRHKRRHVYRTPRQHASPGTESQTCHPKTGHPASSHTARHQPITLRKHQQNVRPGCEDHQGPNVNKAPTKT